MSSVQVSSQPEQAPAQLENCEPGSGVAVSVTGRFAAKAAEQPDPPAPQVIRLGVADSVCGHVGQDEIGGPAQRLP